MEAKIKSNEELESEINILDSKIDLQERERKELTQNINQLKKQVIVLKERLLNNTQYELHN